MEILRYKSAKDFVASYSCDVHIYDSIFCKYDLACEIVEEMIKAGLHICYAELEEEELAGYDKEYYIGVTCDGNIYVSKAYNEHTNSYLYFDDDFAYVSSECNSKIISALKNYRHIYELMIEDYEDENLSGEFDSGCCYSITNKPDGYKTVSLSIDEEFNEEIFKKIISLIK